MTIHVPLGSSHFHGPGVLVQRDVVGRRAAAPRHNHAAAGDHHRERAPHGVAADTGADRDVLHRERRRGPTQHLLNRHPVPRLDGHARPRGRWPYARRRRLPLFLPVRTGQPIAVGAVVHAVPDGDELEFFTHALRLLRLSQITQVDGREFQ